MILTGTIPGAYSPTQIEALTRSNLAAVTLVEFSGAQVSVLLGRRPTPASVAAWRTALQGYVVSHPTPEEVAQTAATNAAVLRQRLQAAVSDDQTFLAIQSPTAGQTAAQVRALTKQVVALTRLLLQLTDSTDGS